jgi:hypothetical protein
MHASVESAVTQVVPQPVHYSDRSPLVIPLEGDVFDWLGKDRYRAALKPWDFRSLGNTRRHYSPKSGRPLTLFSDLEFYSALWHERRTEVLEIFDQVPLLPTSRLRRFASQTGLRKYPAEGRFATTDLVLRIHRAGRSWWEAVSVKPMEEVLTKDRTHRKLSTERLFWHHLNVSWRLDTDDTYPAELQANLRLLAPSARRRVFLPANEALGDAILDAVASALDGPPFLRLTEAFRPIDREFAVEEGMAMSALRWGTSVGRFRVPVKHHITPTMLIAAFHDSDDD